MVDKIIDKLIEGNKQYKWKLMDKKETVELNRKSPKYPVLILTCMDSRIDVHRIFQLNSGDVIVLRNAGNQFSEDIFRSILIAIYEYDVKYVIVLGHLDCGLKNVNLDELKHDIPVELLRELGKKSVDLRFSLQRFFRIISDEIININIQVDRFKTNLVSKNVKIIGMLYDPASGWVFTEEDMEQYSSYENFKSNYKELLQKKQLDHIDFLETIETEIVGSERVEPKLNEVEVNKKIFKTENTNEELNNEVEEKTLIDGKNEQLDLKDLEKYMNLPLKIQLPKIHIPKIKVYIPSVIKSKKDIE